MSSDIPSAPKLPSRTDSFLTTADREELAKWLMQVEDRFTARDDLFKKEINALMEENKRLIANDSRHETAQLDLYRFNQELKSELQKTGSHSGKLWSVILGLITLASTIIQQLLPVLVDNIRAPQAQPTIVIERQAP